MRKKKYRPEVLLEETAKGAWVCFFQHINYRYSFLRQFNTILKTQRLE